MSTKSWPEGYKIRYLVHFKALNDLGIEALRFEWRQVFHTSSNHPPAKILQKLIAMKRAADDVRQLGGIPPNDVSAYLALARERRRKTT